MDKYNINHDWIFRDGDSQSKINIPHTVKIEELEVSQNYQGNFVYSRDMSDVAERSKSRNVFVEFGGMMTNSKIYYNDKLICEHFGGYLPVYVDITKYVGGANILKVELTNYDDRDTPPGKPTKGLDFLYYGGIYRDVNVYFKPNLYITNPFEDSNKNGGIKFICKKTNERYNLEGYINIKNLNKSAIDANVGLCVADNGEIIAKTSKIIKILPGEYKQILLNLSCEHIKEWSIESPKLYDCTVAVDEYSETIAYGFREIAISADGFKLNGKIIKLFGVNRHQQYPYIGIAASSDAERREVGMLKETGINTLRLAHYPQSTAFLDECDKQGILIIECAPGWQYRGGKVWQERLLGCVRDMVRRDRNHPSVVIYEVTPNETHWPTRKGDKFYRKLHLTAKGELENCITSGDTEGRRNAEFVGFDIPYSGRDKKTAFRKLYANGEKKFLKREYGDWGFGGNNSTSRVNIGDGDYPMTLQAFNFQWDRNDCYENENILGDLIWEGIDHNRGYFPKQPISKSGIFNIFRLPKFSYYWVKSQVSPTIEYTLFPAINEYVGKNNFMVYSNCNEVAVVMDGNEIIRKHADSGKSNYFDKSKNKIADNYWARGENHLIVSERASEQATHAEKCLHKGGDCNKLDFPPYTFTGMNLGGKIVEFVGYDKSGKEVKRVTKHAYSAATCLEIEVKTYGIPLKANNNDWVWAYVKAVDEFGQADYKYNNEIKLEIIGGESIGGNIMKSEAGTASFMIKATSLEVIVNATCDTFTKSIKITCVK